MVELGDVGTFGSLGYSNEYQFSDIVLILDFHYERLIHLKWNLLEDLERQQDQDHNTILRSGKEIKEFNLKVRFLYNAVSCMVQYTDAQRDSIKRGKTPDEVRESIVKFIEQQTADLYEQNRIIYSSNLHK